MVTQMKPTTYRERLNRMIGRFPKLIKEWPMHGTPSIATIKRKAIKFAQLNPQPRAVFI